MPYLDLDHTANNSFVNNYDKCLFVCMYSMFFSLPSSFEVQLTWNSYLLFPLKIQQQNQTSLKVSKKLHYSYIEAFTAFERSIMLSGSWKKPLPRA